MYYPGIRYGNENSSESSMESDKIHTHHCTCCNCENRNRCLVKGKFGLAYVVETTKNKTATPVGWQIEFEDTPSGVVNNCNRMVDWAKSPPIGNCPNIKPVFTDYPSMCSKMLKPRNAKLSASTQCQSVNTAHASTSYQINKTIINTENNRAEGKKSDNLYIICDKCRINASVVGPDTTANSEENKMKIKHKNECHCQNLAPHQCHNCCIDIPRDYQGCYWYTDHNLQQCWCTSQTVSRRCKFCTKETETDKMNTDTHDISTSVKGDEILDYIPMRDSLKKTVSAQIVDVKDNQTQCKENQVQYEEGLINKTIDSAETAVIRKVTNKQVGTESLEALIKADKNTKTDITIVDEAIPSINESIVSPNEKIELKAIGKPLSETKTDHIKENKIGLKVEDSAETGKKLDERPVEAKAENTMNQSEKDMGKNEDDIQPKPRTNKDRDENYKIKHFKEMPKNELFSSDLTPLQKINLARKIQKNEIQATKKENNIDNPENKQKIVDVLSTTKNQMTSDVSVDVTNQPLTKMEDQSDLRIMKNN